ncbi:signal peptidase I [Ruminococcus gauvreauii]|uniref:Signal peptidase I n=1 Tax=Ruminococcus gauvreauii TaxID=438033 RepID=A0ABY5VIH9_9FIRM|nr:signal peptidase I [Ruminococcus gauvreauii]UWP59781.1 signal peptidase I [Ruminococcus gauvreauii]
MEVNLRYVRDYFAQTKLKRVLVWILEIVLTIGLAAVLSMMFCQTVAMQEGSMDPTFSAGDKFLVNKAVYRVSAPKRGDVIAFRTSSDVKASTHIKRVIGVPGDTIQINDGTILINGETYVEQRNLPAITNPGLAEEGIKLASDEYFVLGDNRNSSVDSRFADMGNVKRENIIGELWFVISPMSKLGFV